MGERTFAPGCLHLVTGEGLALPSSGKFLNLAPPRQRFLYSCLKRSGAIRPVRLAALSAWSISVPDTPSDAEHLAFNRQKWTDEVRLRQRELDIKSIEADAKTKEQERQVEQLAFAQLEAQRNRWTNPLVVAVFAAAIAAAGNGVVAWLNGIEQRTIEQIKADQGLILESIKANSDPDKAAANLRFLADTALISNSERRAEIVTFLNRRKPGEGPALPSTNSSPQRPVSGADLVQRSRPSIGFLTLNFSKAGGSPSWPSKTGTCFILNDQGYALTAASLFWAPESSGTKITVSLGSTSNPAHPADLISIDNDVNFALLKISTAGESYLPVRLTQSRIQVAQSVFIEGFPQYSELSVFLGNIVSLDEHGRISISTEVSPGMTGSPVFNDTGEVIAMVGGTKFGSNFTIAAPIQLASRLVALAGVGR